MKFSNRGNKFYIARKHVKGLNLGINIGHWKHSGWWFETGIWVDGQQEDYWEVDDREFRTFREAKKESLKILRNSVGKEVIRLEKQIQGLLNAKI